jgi:hypothetical protein
LIIPRSSFIIRVSPFVDSLHRFTPECPLSKTTENRRDDERRSQIIAAAASLQMFEAIQKRAAQVGTHIAEEFSV